MFSVPVLISEQMVRTATDFSPTESGVNSSRTTCCFALKTRRCDMCDSPECVSKENTRPDALVRILMFGYRLQFSAFHKCTSQKLECSTEKLKQFQRWFRRNSPGRQLS